MQNSDSFRRLITGVRFDCDKFKRDSQLFQINKREECENSSDENLNDCEQMTGEKSVKKASKKMSKAKLRNIETERINRLRRMNRVTIKGEDIPKPIESFAALEKYGASETLLENIEKVGYKQPTPVQMEAMPLMIQKRELICCAPTGSGKTLAFLIPLVIQLRKPEKCGFRAIILAPTRELAKQIHRECLLLVDGIGLRVHLIKNVHIAKKKFGTNSKLKFDILVTTPKRLVYLLQEEPPAINIQNIEWLVIDECDKLFETGFREQLSVIYKACENSTSVCRALFSATFDKELETWFQLHLDNVVTLIIGGKNRAADSVEQKLLFVGSEEGKTMALKDLIASGLETPVLIFVANIGKAKKLFKDLTFSGISSDVIHSERTQEERDDIVRRFRAGKIWFLICTELMGRGIDFKGVNILINYDLPKSATAYIHRIGRTGRAGREGKAITFFTENEIKYIRSVVNVMRRSGSEVPQYLLEMASAKRKLLRKPNKSNKDSKKMKKQRNNSKNQKIKVNRLTKISELDLNL
ncbi:putative ATP-dependent RNA helicase DDX52-like protein, partial [Dinothrombium tinctorium]